MVNKLKKQRNWIYVNKPEIVEKNKEGGEINGPSHKEGGVTINVEGGEFIIKKDSVNSETLPKLQEINKTGKLEEDNSDGYSSYEHPEVDSRKRRKNAKSRR